ncbi:hypothetical protein ILUMI_07558 [Ignelater luminosus]|uniref:Uncharacterized protein n=1 Tax=Ignelater luminosus TaxID=2038154 RepID=A0A8K0D948_IGNLU|nr:hypothetical protein ILUMI_07558 [Ignelater luminosus]
MTIELKYKLVWILGYHQKYLWRDLSEELLNEKETICRELLELLEKLEAGKNKMRGLISYELYCCLRERQRRLKLQEVDTVNENVFEEQSKEMESLFEESREILTDDVHAPPEIKFCSSTNANKTMHNDERILAG